MKAANSSATSRRKPSVAGVPAAVATKKAPAKTADASAVRFLYDEKGRKSHVLLDIKLYEQLLYDLEMAEDVQAYREAKALNEPTISWDELKRQVADDATSGAQPGVGNG
jgi:hypothetical protein